MLSQLQGLKIRRRQFFSSLGVVAALSPTLSPVAVASSPAPVLIPIPPDFPPPKFHFGQKVKVEVELEEDEHEIITEYGVVVGMSYEPSEVDEEEEWTYLVRWTQGESSEWLVSAGGTVFFCEWELEPL